MKKMLFATDFSPESQKSFPVVLEVAQKCNAEMILLHVNRTPHTYKFPYTAETFKVEQQEVKRAEKKLQKIFDSHFDYGTGDSIITKRIVRDSSVVRGILTVAEEENVDLVTLAIRGDNNSKEQLFGSLIKSLVKQSIAPVLVIPEDVRKINVDRILFTTNLSPSEILPINALVQLFKSLAPQVTVIHVSDTDDVAHELKLKDFKNLLNRYIDYSRLKFVQIKSNDLFASLDQFIRTNSFDILSMTKHWHFSMFYRMFHKDLVEKMEFSSTIPVLSFNLSSVDNFFNRDNILSESSEEVSIPNVDIKNGNVDQLLSEITAITQEMNDKYPELYRHLDEEPVTISTEDHPQVNQQALEDYLSSLKQLMIHHSEQQRKR